MSLEFFQRRDRNEISPKYEGCETEQFRNNLVVLYAAVACSRLQLRTSARHWPVIAQQPSRNLCGVSVSILYQVSWFMTPVLVPIC